MSGLVQMSGTYLHPWNAQGRVLPNPLDLLLRPPLVEIPVDARRHRHQPKHGRDASAEGVLGEDVVELRGEGGVGREQVSGGGDR